MHGTDKKKRDVWEHISKKEMGCLIATAVLFVFGVGLDVADQPLYEAWKGWGLIALALLFFTGAIPGITRCAAQGPHSIWPVVRGAFVILVIFLVVFYTSFHWIAASAAAQHFEISDKFLNFPPMVIAIWAAGVGWYIHFQASAKNHRTNNAFSLLMQTRTCAEFLNRAQVVQHRYPHGSVVPKEDVELFASSALRDLREQLREAESPDASVVTAEASADTSAEQVRIAKEYLEKAKAADALKYLLNYYEFMSVGIKAKDLDEELLYQTICVTVTSMYARARPFIEHVRTAPVGTAQPLAFTALEELVKKWEQRLADETHAYTKVLATERGL